MADTARRMSSEEPLKVRPYLWYAVLCGLPPTDYRGVLSLNAVVNELVASRLPYSKDFFIVVAWQRGIGTFQFRWQVSDEDGGVLGRSEPVPVVMELRGNQLTLPNTLTVHKLGLYLFEGFLDGDVTFKTTLNVTGK